MDARVTPMATGNLEGGPSPLPTRNVAAQCRHPNAKSTPAHMRILGLSSFTHDTSAALLEDGVVRAAIEESKLVRSKNTSGPPDAAIQFCLRSAGCTWRDIYYVAVSGRPLHGWFGRSLA